MCNSQTIQDVAQHLGVSRDVVKEIQKQDLKRRFGKPNLKRLRHIAFDEISVAKGHRYRTLVMDLDTGVVVLLDEGKGADALKPFWCRFRHSQARIRALAMDMSRAYFDAVTTHLPKVAIVFDRFHVIKLFNDKLSELRRSLYHTARGQ
jgi:transposase